MCSDIEHVLHNKMFIWYEDNHLTTNTGKCHLQLRHHSENFVQIGCLHIKSSTSGELPSNSINIDLKFEEFKIHAQPRIVGFISSKNLPILEKLWTC